MALASRPARRDASADVRSFSSPTTGSAWHGFLEHFPEARGYAAPEVVSRAVREAEFNKTTKYWTSRFPGELPETPVVPEVLNSDEIRVDGQVANLIDVGRGDVEGSTISHVPSATQLFAVMWSTTTCT